MLGFFILAVYMSIFILSKWNFYIVTGHMALYGNGSHEEETTLQEQERKHLL